ncbi:hypothetical protein [Deinococcus daejeonensis]|uniref:hypothetical protein n=1 Tax=Deinococcus daejeonensis TaxID=1007098 RepID=UPI0016632F66|nr:hypothetical protein [Deinococcus daejeonensis]
MSRYAPRSPHRLRAGQDVDLPDLPGGVPGGRHDPQQARDATRREERPGGQVRGCHAAAERHAVRAADHDVHREVRHVPLRVQRVQRRWPHLRHPHAARTDFQGQGRDGRAGRAAMLAAQAPPGVLHLERGQARADVRRRQDQLPALRGPVRRGRRSEGHLLVVL